MNWKHWIAISLTALLTMSMVAGCGAGKTSEKDASNADRVGTAPKKKLTLWATGSDNVRTIFETLTKDFNTNSEYAGKFEVELQFMLSGTGTQTLTDMIIAAHQAGEKETSYDLVDLSGDDWSKLVSRIGEDAFVKLDQSQLPNASKITAKNAVGQECSLPYRGTTVVLAYDSAKVPEPPKTVGDLVAWMKKNPGRFAYNTPGTGGAGDSFARTSVYNTLPTEAIVSDDEKWVKEWDKGFAYLKDIHQYMYKSGGSVVYPNKNQGTLDLLNQGEIDMCPNWADMVLSQRAKGAIKDSIKIAQISPSFTGSLQSLVIPKFGSNNPGAYAFMNYILSKQAQTIMVKEMAAIPLIDSKEIDLKGYEDLANLDVSAFRIMSIGKLSTAFNERWDREIATIG